MLFNSKEILEYKPEPDGNKSGKYGSFLMSMMLSYILGWSKAAIALLIRTAIIIGTICVICPVISNIITLTEIVCVTAPEKAAAPTVAYPPVNLNLMHVIVIK